MARPAFLFSLIRIFLVAVLLGGIFLWSDQSAVAATQIDIYGPDGSGEFGHSFTVLPNGNIVVPDPGYDGGNGVDEGAVYLYNGTTGALISTLTGTQAGDQVGSGGVTVLSNGNYVVSSPAWNNGAGAVTWGSGTGGVSGQVSSTNSLVGRTAGDGVGSVDLLEDGNYVVISPSWDNGAAVNTGAVTWGDGTHGTLGPISAENSVRGITSGGGDTLIYQYDEINNQLVVGRDKDNIITLFKLPQVLPPAHKLFLPITRR